MGAPGREGTEPGLAQSGKIRATVLSTQCLSTQDGPFNDIVSAACA